MKGWIHLLHLLCIDTLLKVPNQFINFLIIPFVHNPLIIHHTIKRLHNKIMIRTGHLPDKPLPKQLLWKTRHHLINIKVFLRIPGRGDTGQLRDAIAAIRNSILLLIFLEGELIDHQIYSSQLLNLYLIEETTEGTDFILYYAFFDEVK